MHLSHALKTGFLALAIAGCGVNAPKTADQASVLHADGDGECYEGEEFECAAEREILRLNNEYRASSGRSALATTAHANWTARDWSKKQGARGSIGHDGFPGARTSVHTGEFGSMEGIWFGGENVAYFGGSGDLSPEEAGRRLAQMWWNSSGHRANMLGNYAGVGIGVFKTRSGSVFGTQIFYQDSAQ